MQATTALLLSLSFVCFPDQTTLPSSSSNSKSKSTSNSTSTSTSKSASASASVSVSESDPAIPNALALLDTDIETVIAQSKKALHSIHTLAEVDPAARRAFLLCDGVVRRLAPVLKIDLRDWPRAEGLVGGVGGVQGEGQSQGFGQGRGQHGEFADDGSGMEGLEDLVDFDGGGG